MKNVQTPNFGPDLCSSILMPGNPVSTPLRCWLTRQLIDPINASSMQITVHINKKTRRLNYVSSLIV